MHRRSSSLATLLFVLFLAACGSGARPASGGVEDPANQLPFGFIDGPKGGDTVNREVVLRGWALDDSGVANVRVYIDDHYWTTVAINDARPDVRAAYDTLAHGTDKHGWWSTEHLPAGIAGGEHTLLFQAVDTNGATHDIGTVKITVKP